MTTVFRFIITAVLAIAFVGCGGDDKKEENAMLIVSTSTLNLKSETGSYAKFSITTQGSWTTVVEGDGFVLDKMSGAGSTEIKVTASGANASEETKTLGTITLYAPGIKEPWTVQVKQLGVGAPDPDGQVMLSDIVGSWKLTEWSVDSEFKEGVYLKINADKTFVLYQNIVSHGYERLPGTFALQNDGSISGVYDGGKTWGTSYKITDFSENTMTWVTASGNDTSVYTREEIPQDIAKSSRAVTEDSGFRFL